MNIVRLACPMADALGFGAIETREVPLLEKVVERLPDPPPPLPR